MSAIDKGEVQVRSLSRFIHPVLGLAALGTASAVMAQAGASGAPAAPNRAAISKEIDVKFKQLDADSDGTLTVAEVAAAQTRAQQELAAKISKTLGDQFTKLDVNNDGQVSRAEFMAAAPAAKPVSEDPNALVRFDANKDSKVSLAEYRTSVLAAFDRVDTNRDGTLSAAERNKAAAARPVKN